MWLLTVFLSCQKPQVSRLDEWTAGVRYRPVSPPNALAEQIVGRLPNAQWDSGLYLATQSLMSAMPKRSSRITPEITRLATARAGFPGQARFAKILNGGAFPEELVEEIMSATGIEPIDVAMVRRDYGDGISLWLAAWAPHIVDVDPLPVQIPLDDRLLLRADVPDTHEAVLFISPPMGAVTQSVLDSEAYRIIDQLHIPGEWVFEIVTTQHEQAPQVAALFSVFVDVPLPEMGLLPDPLTKPESPVAAEAYLYTALNDLRRDRGLPPLERFELFESLAREHSAWMAHTGVVSHQIENVTPGVSHHAANLANPRAEHYQNVASAYTAAEAFGLAADSAGHLQSFLCETCTHVSIGAALEPTLDRMPRIFVTWEILDFVQGEPKKIDKLRP